MISSFFPQKKGLYNSLTLGPAPSHARLTLLLMLLCGLAAAAWADTIILRDNREITGVVDPTATDANNVSVRTNAGTIRIPRANILHIQQEQGISFTESSGDLSLAENKLERALDLYQKALEKESDNPRLKQKIERTQQQIAKRDETFYGTTFDQIRQLITAGQFETAIQQATDLAAKVRADEARARCRKLIAEAHIGLGRKYRDTVNYAEAEKNFNLAAQSDPTNPTSKLELAEMLGNTPARKIEAIPLYEQAIELASRHPDKSFDGDMLLKARFELGKLYRDEHHFDKAAETLLEVMRLDTAYRFPQAVDLAIDSYDDARKAAENAAKGKTAEPPNYNKEKIIANLESIIRVKPTETRAHLLLGRIYFDRREWAKARERLQVAGGKAAPAGETRQEALYYLGLADHKLGDLAGAAAALQQLLEMNAASYDAICELADIHLEQSDYTNALALFKRAQDMDKERYRAYMGMGDAQQKLAQYEQARENFHVVVAKDPTNARAQLNIAQSYFDEEKWDETAVEAEKAVTVLVGDEKSSGTVSFAPGTSNSLLLAQTQTLIGNATLNLKNSNHAREIFQLALKQEPNYAPALDGIGRTYQADSLHKDAEAFFDKAIAADPKNPDYRLSMGINWHKYRKDPAKALPYYNQYIELGGKDPNVRAWIKECGGTPPA